LNVKKPEGVSVGQHLRDTQLTPDKLKIGAEIEGNNNEWIITEVLGDGKFKAVRKNNINAIRIEQGLEGKSDLEVLKEIKNKFGYEYGEQFDISGKVDTNNPIYKFYEKEMGKYLKSKYNAKEIIDDQGVSWYEVDIKPEMKGSIEAFGIGAIPLATQINQDKK
jgi:hypothetical protein